VTSWSCSIIHGAYLSMCVWFYSFFVCLLVSRNTYDFKSNAVVPSCREFHGHIITAHHSYAFSTSRRDSGVAARFYKQPNKRMGDEGKE